MTRRRAPRLTHTKKSKVAKKATSELDAPTDKEWAGMQPFGRFNVVDEDGKEFAFKVGDNALILPENGESSVRLQEHRYWLGKIKDIRCRQRDGPDVWAYVQWYYSGSDASQVVKSFDSSTCSSYERMLSDTYDYVSSSSFEGIVKVKRYYEDSVEQTDIEDDDFFYRYEFEYALKRISRLVPDNEMGNSDSIKPGANTCLCKIPYAPANTSIMMHFCPRPSCRRWYHEKCLKGIKSTFSPSMRSDETAALQHYLSTSPLTDDTISLPTESDTPASPPAKRRRGGASKSRIIIPVDDTHESVQKQRLDSIPKELLLAAQQPIVKGRALGEGNLVGNIRMVVEARKAVFGVLDGEELTDDWDDLINSGAALVEESLPLFLCPKCRSVI